MIINFQGTKIQTSDFVYTPAEDSFFMQDVLTEYFSHQKSHSNFSTIAEMGCGSGYNLITLMKLFPTNHFIAIDINPYALDLTSKNIELNDLDSSKVQFIESDLFSKVHEMKFDVLVFNPPYLPPETTVPLTEEQKMAILTWEGGDEVINKFLNSSQDYVSEKGLIFLILSNFQVKDRDIKNYIEINHPSLKVLTFYKRKIVLETLYLLIMEKK